MRPIEEVISELTSSVTEGIANADGRIMRDAEQHQQLYEINARLTQIEYFLQRLTPLVEYAETMLNSTPTQRIKAVFGKK